MKKRLVLKSFLQIFLVVSLSFIFSLNMVVASEDVCCKETINGNFCEYTNSANCVSDSFPGVCESFSLCQPVCCDLTESLQGCLKNVPEAVCLSQGGSVLPDADCGYNQCQNGCCVVGSDCIFTSDKECGVYMNNYPGLDKDFRSASFELECQSLCLEQKKGCCLVSDGVSSYITENECKVLDGEFFDGLSCGASQLTKQTGCGGHAYKECVEGSDDVYWFDSCGNMEEVAEECSFGDGFICEDREGDIGCYSINCDSTWDNELNDHDTSGGSVLFSESWCQYDGNVGPTLDLPGSRHYRHYCLNGQEYALECGEYREEICIQGNSEGGSLTAQCVENNFEGCYECLDKLCCEDSSDKNCVWVSNAEGVDPSSVADEYLDWTESSKEEGELDEMKKDSSYEVNAGFDEDLDGICLPLVPPGIQFWREENTGSYCSFANSDGNYIPSLDTYWAGIHEYDCDGGCQMFTEEFATGLNTICRSMGDCGADYNLEGKWSKAGFTRSCAVDEDAIDLRDDPGDVHGVEGYGDDDADKLVDDCELYVSDPGEFNDRKFYSGFLDMGMLEFSSNPDFWDTEVGVMGIGDMGDLFEFSLVNFVGSFGFGLEVGSSIYGLFGDEWKAHLGGLLLGGMGDAGAMIKGSIAFSLGIFMAITYFMYDSSTQTLEASCNVWSAPLGDKDCSLCQEEYSANGLHECTEYLCKSLGKSCEFIDTEEGGICQGGLCDYDTESPKVFVKDISCEMKDGECEGSAESYGYNIDGKIKPYTEFSFEIETYQDFAKKEKDYATCRWDFVDHLPDKGYEETFSYFAYGFNQVGNSFVHNYTLAAKDVKPGEHKIFIKCQDHCGKSNDASYAITFEVDKGPDLTAPVILDFIPENPAYVASIEDSLDVTLILNENVMKVINSEFDSGCKFDYEDLPYLEMKNDMFVGGGGFGIDSKAEGKITNLIEGSNKVYFKCMDREGNANKESWPFGGYEIIRTNPLEIISVSCLHEEGMECDNIYQGEFTLQVLTSEGAEEGLSKCYFAEMEKGVLKGSKYLMPSEEEYLDVHEVILGPLDTGSYEYLVECVDKANNVVNKSFEFNMFVDEEAPVIDKVYLNGGLLYVETNEWTKCRYSPNSSFSYSSANAMLSSDGFYHSVVHEDGWYFKVGCEDKYGNLFGPTSIKLVGEEQAL